MKITAVRIKRVSAQAPSELVAFQYGCRGCRMLNPTDIYPDFGGQTSVVHCIPDKTSRILSQCFVEILTDEGLIGVYGPIGNAAVLHYIKAVYAPAIIGLDPLAGEKIWDIMFRLFPRAYAGEQVFALSAIDNALWDIRCKAAGLPLYRMLGGPAQSRIMAYANCTGFSNELPNIECTVKELKRQGYSAIKWYLPYGPGSGKEGLRSNIQILEALRAAAGDDMRIMIDVWSGWDLSYTRRMLGTLQSLNIHFLEEPLLPVEADNYAALVRESPIDIAFGENLFLRWGFKRFLERVPNAVYQPDPEWCGGITETLHIISLLSSYGARMCMHASSTQLVTQMSLSVSPGMSDMVEYILSIAPPTQYFLKTPMHPKDGYITLPDNFIGTGHDIDESRVETVTYE